MLSRQLIKAFITSFMFFFLATTSAVAMDFFEDFNGAGVPPNHTDYWYKMNEIYPSQSSWEDYIPGDGHVYITVDNSSSWGDYQGIGVGWIPLIGQRMEVRMKGAILPGYVGFIFTYASSADEIDIELLTDDTQGEGGVHDPYAWSDARFNSTINGQNWNSNFQGIVDDTGSRVSHYEDDTYHTYTIDHFGDKIVFYIDGVYQETCTWSIPTDDSEIILGFRDLDFAGATNWSGTRTLTIDWLNVKEIDSNSPVAAADRYATDQSTSITIAGSGILANDTGSNLIADLVSDVAHGTLSLNVNGSFTYTPDSGFVGEDHFVYFANDGTPKGESNAARVLLRVGQPVEWQKVDDTNANIAYSAGWETYVGSGGYLNTEHYSETSGSTATFSFNGTQARYYGFKRNDLGKVNIYVDGAYVTTLDLYSSTFSGNYMLFETAVLASGSHTLSVELDGTQNSSSSGYEANIDAFSWVDMGANPPALLEQTIMSWVAPYAIPESQAMAEADFGVCDPKDALTRVGLQFWTPNTDGTIKYANHEWYTPTDDDVAWWTEWGQTNGIKILLTIYNNTGSWDWNLARSAFADNRTTFVNALVSEMDRLNLDGIDIDLEGIGSFNGDRAAFDQFIHDLSVQVKARDKILTVDSFHYVWNAPNHDWWSDWLGEVDSIHSMGYDDLYEGGTDYQKYSFQQDAGYAAGYAGNAVLMGMPAWENNHSSWGASSGRGTSAQAHIQEVRYDLAEPTGIAIWDMQLLGWQDNSALWCEIAELKTETTTVLPPTPQSPYYGIPQAIPGQIEAEDFDLGDDGLAYHDCDAANQGGAYRASSGVDIEASTEGGYNVGWICANEWLEYTVDVVSTGTYNIEMRVASNTIGGAFHIEFDGVDKTGDISVPVTGGWQNWVSVTATVNLSAGVQVMRFANSNSASGEYNISYYSFSAAGGNAAPNANFSPSMDSLTATFTDTSTDSDGSIASWSWGFGDGGTSTEQNPSHTYATADTYTVTLTVTDDGGVIDSTSQSVTVNTLNSQPTPNPMTLAVAPYLNPSWPSDNVATMTATTASDPDGGIEYYFQCIEAAGGMWNGCEDSGWQAGSTFSDWFLLEGNSYHYRVKARDALGNETGWSAEAAITVGSASTVPTADFSFTTYESTLAVDFMDSSTDSDGSVASWFWNFGDGGTSTAQSPSHTYASAATYAVTLTVTDNDGNSDTANLNVTVPLIPGGTKKSLVIMLDGLRSDGIISANTPYIDSLINGTFGGGTYNGAYAYYAQTIQDKPTSSAYNHVSIMTGVTGDKHGASGNDYNGIAAADYNTYPTYLSTLESDNSNLNTAFLVTWGADLGMVSGADYVYGQSDASNVDRAVNIIQGTFSDGSGDNGTSWSSGTDVDAIALFLDDIDGAGHTSDYSPADAIYISEVESVDVQIGQILTAIQNRSNFANENWQIIITSDHGGFAGTHGNLDPNSETIPFIVASKSVSQGLLPNRVINYDAAATALAHHLGETAIPANYDGVAQGNNVIAAAPADLTDSMVVYLPFDGNTLDASGRSNDASIGAGSDHDPIVNSSGGKFGGYVEINDFGGGASNSSYLTLGTTADLNFGADTHFTITTWFRAQASQAGDPVIMGNKSWADGFNKGVLLLGDESSNGDGFGVNISDGTSRRDIEPINYSFNEWWFQAISVDRNGNAVMFVGSPNGELYVISDFADDLGDITSSLPWNIGQDGTGAYAYNLDGDIDEMAIWRRSLSLDEIRQLYNSGSGLDLQGLVNQGNQAPVASFTSTATDLTVDFTDDSSDSDGTIASRSWNFGDGTTSTSLNPSHTYSAADTYTVSLTVTDNNGATESISKSVTVTAPPPPDTEAPSITAPVNVTVEATGVTTSVNLGSPTVSDDIDLNPTVTNDAPAAFPIGTTTVTWTATDNSGNSASATQTVTVTDTTAPTITAPDNVNVESSEPVAVALGTPTVSDLADPDPTVTDNAPTTFPLGTTIVTWTATDASGNLATDTQTVIVTEPPPPVEIHVGDLAATASGNKRWTATVTVTVHDSFPTAVAGVTVSGTWSDGSSGSCVTDDIGQCSTARITKELRLTFTVYSLSNGDDIYDDGANIVTSITINKDGSTTTPGGDTTPPTITLLGQNPVTITVGSTYDDAGATAYDNVDGDRTTNIQTVSTVNTDVAGTYTVIYNVSDNVGNAADQIVRTVTVTDPGALAAPTDLSAKLSRRTETVALKWNDSNSGEDGFIIERSKDGSVIGTVTVNDATSYIDDLSGDTGTFSYRVKAYKGTDESDYSDSASILKK